ncbi:MAG: TIGR02266 family protein [Myxococcota bacterium]|nr:TIGR02266 family protein [Myxococcota bacterium]
MSDQPPDNRRKHPRRELALLVQYRFNSLEAFLAEYATNLSPGGMFIRTDQPSPVGTTLHLQFSLKDGSRLIDGLVRVARVVTAGTHEHPAGMGVEFVDFDPELRALIQRLYGPAR